MSSYDFEHIFDYTGGENQASSPDNLRPNECLLFRNVDLGTRGGFKRRHGISEYKAINDKRVDRLVEFEYDNDGAKALKKLALINGELIDLSNNAILKTGLGRELDYEIYKNKVYILSNGQYLVYDGAEVKAVTANEENNMLNHIAKCRYIEQRGQRFFASGNPDDPNALYFSEIARPDYFKSTAGNPIMAISDDADKITGLKEFHGALLVFKSRTIYAWFGYDPMRDVEFHQLNVHTGTKSYRTIQNVGSYLLYLGEDGVYALHGTYKDVISTFKVSKNITPTIDSIKHKEPFYKNTPCAVFYDNKYLLSVSTGDNAEENDTVLVLFLRALVPDENEPWAVYTGWNISDFLHSFDDNLYSASSVTGRVHIHDKSFNDLGEGIEVSVKMKPISAGAPVHNKKFRRGYIAFRQFETFDSTLTVKIGADYESRVVETSPDESLIWDRRDWGVSNWGFIDLVTRRFDVKKKCKRLTVEFYDNTPDHNLMVYGIAVEHRLKKPDRT